MDLIPMPAALLSCLLLPLRGQEPCQKQVGIGHRGRSQTQYEESIRGSGRSIDILERYDLPTLGNHSDSRWDFLQKGYGCRICICYCWIIVHSLSVVFQRAWRILGNESWKICPAIMVFVFAIRTICISRTPYLLVFIQKPAIQEQRQAKLNECRHENNMAERARPANRWPWGVSSDGLRD